MAEDEPEPPQLRSISSPQKTPTDALYAALGALALSPAAGNDIKALAAVVSATAAGHAPRPLAVASAHPDAPSPLAPTQLRSISGWVEPGVAAAHLPSRQEFANDCRRAIFEASANCELLEERAAANRATPSADDPEAMSAAAYHLGWEALKPATPRPFPALEPLPEGHLPALNPAGLLAAHRGMEGLHACINCAAGSPCHRVAAINLLSAVSLPWSGRPAKGSGDTKDSLRAAPAPVPYGDGALAAAVIKLCAKGALRRRELAEVKYFSPCFLARLFNAELSPEEVASIDAGGASGSQAAYAAAQRRADVFLAAQAESLRAAAPPESGGQPAQPRASQVHAAWQAGEAAAYPVVKDRFVTALGDLSPHLIPLRCRYARAMDSLSHVRKGWHMAKCDAEAGYYQVKVDPADAAYLGVAVELDATGTVGYFTYERLPMGLGPSGYVFSMYSGLVHEIFRSRVSDAVISFVYLDDIVILCADYEACATALETLLAVMRECGMSPNLKKTSSRPVGVDGPQHAEVVLGLRVDLRALTVRLPAEKLVRTITSAIVLDRCAESALPVPERALAQLGGRLVWCAVTDPGIAAYTRELCTWTDFAHWHGRWRAWRMAAYTWAGPLVPRQRAAMQWFINHARRGALTGTALLCPELRSGVRVVFTTDATGVANAVCVSSEGAMTRFVLPDCDAVQVAALEALALVFILWRFGETLRGCTIVVGTDALGVCYQVVAGKARDDAANDLQRLVRAACTHYDVIVVQKWLTRWWNWTSDQGADHPLSSLAARGVPTPPVLEELSVSGLPHQFLGEWAEALVPGFTFSVEAWLKRHDRGVN